jgi:hypothetical protein
LIVCEKLQCESSSSAAARDTQIKSQPRRAENHDRFSLRAVTTIAIFVVESEMSCRQSAFSPQAFGISDRHWCRTSFVRQLNGAIALSALPLIARSASAYFDLDLF